MTLATTGPMTLAKTRFSGPMRVATGSGQYAIRGGRPTEGGGIGVGATCQRGRQWSTERCFVPCSACPLRLSLGSLETVTLTAVGSVLEMVQLQ